MERIEYHAPLTECQCLQLPVGTLLRYNRYYDYIQHLVHVAAGANYEAAGYDLCPITGVLWAQTYVPAGRIDEIALYRTGCCQSSLDYRTVAHGVARLYETPLEPPADRPRMDYQLPRGMTPPLFPDLPLQGLVREILQPRQEMSWACGEVQVVGRTSLWLWVYLLAPLERGGVVGCYVASPLEVLSAQGLREGLVLAWWFAGREIGEVRVEGQERVSVGAFGEWFGFDKVYRDLGAEFSEWLRQARRRRR